MKKYYRVFLEFMVPKDMKKKDTNLYPVLYSSIKGQRVSIKHLSTPSVFNSTLYG